MTYTQPRPLVLASGSLESPRPGLSLVLTTGPEAHVWLDLAQGEHTPFRCANILANAKILALYNLRVMYESIVEDKSSPRMSRGLLWSGPKCVNREQCRIPVNNVLV